MNKQYVLAVHGGAGTIAPNANTASEAPYRAALQEAVAAGEAILAAGGSALDAVIASVIVLEDCPLFNAGHGAVYTSDATHEMDAIVMDGRNLAAGAVASVRTIRNPVVLARAVMDKSSCVLLGAEGAERFARECGVSTVDPEYFGTPARLEQLKRVQAQSAGALLDHDGASRMVAKPDPIDPDHKFGTVGAVARDRNGNLASAVSTGGLTNKRPGRVGDTPIIGAGCYADNRTVAVAATGTGEHFMRAVAAHDIAARMAYGDLPLDVAASQTVFEKLTSLGGQGGVIAIDHEGNLVMPFNTSGMYRGWVFENRPVSTAIFK